MSLLGYWPLTMPVEEVAGKLVPARNMSAAFMGLANYSPRSSMEAFRTIGPDAGVLAYTGLMLKAHSFLSASIMRRLDSNDRCDRASCREQLQQPTWHKGMSIVAWVKRWDDSTTEGGDARKILLRSGGATDGSDLIGMEMWGNRQAGQQVGAIKLTREGVVWRATQRGQDPDSDPNLTLS